MSNMKQILTLITGVLSEQGMQVRQLAKWLEFPLHALILCLSHNFMLNKSKRRVHFIWMRVVVVLHFELVFKTLFVMSCL